MKLNLPLAKFDDLFRAVNEARGKEVRVSREDLFNLLRDHSNAIAELRKVHIEIEEV